MPPPARFNIAHVGLMLAGPPSPRGTVALTHQVGLTLLTRSVGLLVQCLLTRVYYLRWLFGSSGSLECARAQYMLSTVCWHPRG